MQLTHGQWPLGLAFVSRFLNPAVIKLSFPVGIFCPACPRHGKRERTNFPRTKNQKPSWKIGSGNLVLGSSSDLVLGSSSVADGQGSVRSLDDSLNWHERHQSSDSFRKSSKIRQKLSVAPL